MRVYDGFEEICKRLKELDIMKTCLEDKEETIYSAELYLLRKVAETSSDMIKARDWPEFREHFGGQIKLDEAHASALNKYEQWVSDGDLQEIL